MKNTKKNKNKQKAKQQTDLLELIDAFFEKNRKLLFRIFLAISFLFTLLLFNLKVSVGGDDANYIIRAYDFIHHFKYPAFQGPLYPMILSIFVGIFGINLPVLKFFSTLLLAGHFVAFYYAFKNKVPASILFSTLILISLNTFLLFYGSQTYSEAFFMFMQMMFFIFFFKNFINSPDADFDKRKQITVFLYLGVFLLTLGLIRSIGYVMLIVVVIYFLTQKEWKNAIYSVLSFSIFSGLWKIFKMLMWKDTALQFGNQASSLMMVHPYDATKGTETFMGFIQRFIDNSNIYISKYFFQMLNLRPELIETAKGYVTPVELPVLTILVYATIIWAVIYSFKRNKYLLFSGIYLASGIGLTFVILQTIWAAYRLIIPFLPLLIMFSLLGVYDLLKLKKLKALQLIFPLIVLMLFYSSFKNATVKIKENQAILKKNMAGNMLAGLTPDWQNYIKMTQWAAKNIPENEVIACRKPNIAFIYTKRRFFGIYKVPQNTDADSLLQNLYNHKVKYIIMASLRKYEAQKTKYTINTIYRYMYFIRQKYPNKFLLVKQIGVDEPAYLIRIN
jgi:hypothetical protein